LAFAIFQAILDDTFVALPKRLDNAAENGLLSLKPIERCLEFSGHCSRADRDLLTLDEGVHIGVADSHALQPQ